VTPTPTHPKSGIRLRTRVILGFVLLTMLFSSLTLTVVFLNFRSQLRDSLRQRLISIVSLAALQQDGDAFQSVQSEQDPAYISTWSRNTAILESDPDLVFVYTMRYDEQGLYFVVDAGDPNSDLFSNYGVRYESPGQGLLENYKTISEPFSEPDFYQDEYGFFLSAYAPIVDSQGQVVGIIGADMAAGEIIAGENQLLLITLGLFSALLPVIILAGWLMGRNLASPIETITSTASRITEGELNYRPVVRSSIPEITSLTESFFAMADQQGNLIESLEERVTARTSELSRANEQVLQKVSQLQTISEVARSISITQNIDQLLQSITQTISQRFNFYHVGVFLLDPAGEYAVLRAANSPGGRKMLERSHQLKVGEVGIVGYSAGSGKPRIALDVGQDAVFFNNPDLPETSSEMALPLLVQEKVIGVLDLQSTEKSAFKEDEFDAYRTLADQVAIAIENARLLGETRRALLETESAYGDFVRMGWQRVAQEGHSFGVRHANRKTRPLSEFLDYEEIERASREGDTVAGDELTGSVAIPLTIRNEVIGVLDIRFPENRALGKEEIRSLQRVVDRAALALENARLLEDAQGRAARERTVSEITTKIRSHNEPQAMLDTALKELRNVLGTASVQVLPLPQPGQQESSPEETRTPSSQVE